MFFFIDIVAIALLQRIGFAEIAHW
jgi:hypothetical protein